jgi:hypothetical protein
LLQSNNLEDKKDGERLKERLINEEKIEKLKEM